MPTFYMNDHMIDAGTDYQNITNAWRRSLHQLVQVRHSDDSNGQFYAPFLYGADLGTVR